jgi:LysM repeat protein
MRTLNRRTLLVLAAGLAAAQSVGAQDTTTQRPAGQLQIVRPSTHTVVRGDNLWDLSQTYLGNPFLWPEIYRLNRDVVEDPHWIYPGEVLRLPGDTTPAVSQLPAGGLPAPTAPPVTAQPPVEAGAPVDPSQRTVFSRPESALPPPVAGPGGVGIGIVGLVTAPTVREGEVLLAPYMDREGGPRGFGRILKTADIAGIAEASERYRFQAYDRVLIDPPAGYVAPEGERYLAIKLGPVFENQGQIMIPTGVVEVFRSAGSTTGAVAKVIRVFHEISTTDRLIPLDTAGVGSTIRPVKVNDGPSAKITWVYGEPVLASIQNYVILNVSSRNGVRMGDEFIVYQPSPKPEEGQPRDRETLIAKAKVVRSTPYGVTAIIVGQEQPSIKEGMSARLSAKMP